MFEAINKNVSKATQFTQSELEYFDSLLQLKIVPKKTLLLQEGEICSFEAYINKGCTRTFYINENGFEVILQFSTEDWWLSDIASFHEKKPSKLYIETLEDCELIFLSLENKEALLVKIPSLKKYIS
ncbi:Crp/Fnr family transcriptional regulator [Flavobacterium sp. ZS1P70]|uniref:Crp/Fnr family transcriptional regulator n=1 Tax=Flavobacterium zhoui TaxID=3230414 RepID=A0ABW6I7I2_9FLAO